VGLNPAWVLSIADVESSMGKNQLSPTGAKGVFQMTSIAMKDLLEEMKYTKDDTVDILCGLAFLYLLYKRWNGEDSATVHFCAPKDRDFYLKRMRKFREEWSKKILGKSKPIKLPPGVK